MEKRPKIYFASFSIVVDVDNLDTVLFYISFVHI